MIKNARADCRGRFCFVAHSNWGPVDWTTDRVGLPYLGSPRTARRRITR